MTVAERVRAFLAAGPFAVVGASPDRAKFGNRVLRKYVEHDLPVRPVNPRGGEIERLPAARSLTELCELWARPGAVSIITPPAVTEEVVQEALELGIEHLWMQPGAESEHAVQLAEAGGASVLWGGPCLLVEL